MHCDRYCRILYLRKRINELLNIISIFHEYIVKSHRFEQIALCLTVSITKKF